MTGNLAKDRIILELGSLFSSEPKRVFRVLDVGVTGPRPLQFWEPLFAHPNFELTGVDVDAPSIEKLAARTLPPQAARFEALSGYDIAGRFGEDAFDIIVSTQVLEHMRRPERFVEAAFRALAPGGLLFLCFDSGDFPRPSSALKEMLKGLVVRVTGSERYHDKDIPSAEAASLLERSGFRILERRWYNIHPMKRIQNHEVAEEARLEIGRLWLALEDALNDRGHAAAHPERYLGVLFKALKPS